MKKIILVLITSVFALLGCAQDADIKPFKEMETNKELNLTDDQTAKIKKLNHEAGAKFKAIGKSNLPGYEKGQRKKAIAIELKNDIKQLLTESQIKTWESYYGSMDKNEGLRDIVKDDYDTALDKLELNYEKNKKDVENNRTLTESAKKDSLDILKTNYKAEKERLKNEKDKAVKSGLLNE